jgi:hypothetical protein
MNEMRGGGLSQQQKHLAMKKKREKEREQENSFQINSQFSIILLCIYPQRRKNSIAHFSPFIFIAIGYSICVKLYESIEQRYLENKRTSVRSN